MADATPLPSFRHVDRNSSGAAPLWNSPAGPLVPKGPFGIMGIVNLTPDSFYAQSRASRVDEAVERCLSMLDEGADVLDLGAESSRPGAKPVPSEEETARLLPVLDALLEARPDAVVSVDTYHAKTARAALEHGARVVNDISAASLDPDLLGVLAETGPAYVLMHAKGTPETMQKAPSYTDVTGEVARFFEEKMELLVRAGLPEENILLDPGIGFGKRAEHNLALMAGTAPWKHLGRPSLMALSMKSVFGDLLGLPVEERGCATQVATALAARAGYAWHRVHDVAGARNALTLAAALA